MAEMRAVYYDTETTGVRSEVDRIVEIAAYDVLNDRQFNMLVNPGIPIPQEATAIHGISDEMVANAPSFKEVGEAFMEFCQETAVLIAHNNDAFDRHFLRAESKRHNIEFPQWKMVDSLKWARKYRSDLPRHSLQFLRQTYGIEENNAHRALDDVIVLYQIFSALTDDLPIETIIKLLEEDSSNSASPEVMPFGKHQGKPLSLVPPDYITWLKKQGAFDKPENASLKEAFEKLV